MELQERLQSLLLCAVTLVLFPPSSNSRDTISPIQSLREGETLISSGQSFALGFFTPGNSSNSKNRYVGIWYNKIPGKTVVWVANRENPVTNSSGSLSFKGVNLVLVDEGLKNTTLWSTNVSMVANYSTATLMDSGNLVLLDDQQRVLWESFDYPTNTQLPGTKLGLDRRTGQNRILTSWKSQDDPARGDFSFQLGPEGLPEFILMEGLATIWRTGPWNGLTWSGEPGVDPGFRSHYRYSYVANKDEVTVYYNLYNTTILMRVVLDVSGHLQALAWTDKSRKWSLFWEAPADICDRYGKCGPYGSCDPSHESTECSCLRGFEPKRPTDWSMKERSDGCVRSRPLDCGGKTDGSLRLARVKLPDTSRAQVEPGLSLKACEEECLKNCSCTAFASLNINGERDGCVIWDGDLMDLKVFTVGGQDLFMRMAASELVTDGEVIGFSTKKKHMVVIIISVVAATAGMLLLSTYGYFLWRRHKRKEGMTRSNPIDLAKELMEHITLASDENISGLPLFNFHTIIAATNNFSSTNKLGEGGFGPVYKGQLSGGPEIAVKRLSKSSGQGLEEFKNEVELIAKLQHRNLVRLLGWCIHSEEMMLIYEFMPNKSLDKLIFEPAKEIVLDWGTRFHIIDGIAQGLLYLHRHSRLRIIHRDLKTSNILLDDSMNPKISDFGLARIFQGNQNEANTKRVVGTYGYMSPEYALDGHFSEKSDVFSFGVVLLEIVSGKRNTGFYPYKQSVNLLGYAWELWREGRGLELIDPLIGDLSVKNEVMKCIHVALLCVQESPSDRPSMSSVIFMLGNETATPPPKQPAFSTMGISISTDQPSISID